MAKQVIKTSVIKHNTEANWATSTYIPAANEIIIYDVDSNNTTERFKLGNGTATVSNLAFVTSSEVNKIAGKGLSSNDYTTEDKNKLAGIEFSANNYTHPDSHPASMIEQDSLHRFVTDVQISNWDNNSGTGSGYTHPDTHPASMIEQDSSHRFVTDDQINSWDAKSDFSGSYDDLTDKPTTYAASSIIQDSDHCFVTAAQIEKWNSMSAVSTTVELTQTEYDALADKDAGTLYVVTEES